MCWPLTLRLLAPLRATLSRHNGGRIISRAIRRILDAGSLGMDSLHGAGDLRQMGGATTQGMANMDQDVKRGPIIAHPHLKLDVTADCKQNFVCARSNQSSGCRNFPEAGKK